ncbi:Uncharacterized protein APZ42_003724, partial [Daphnia magna]
AIRTPLGAALLEGARSKIGFAKSDAGSTVVVWPSNLRPFYVPTRTRRQE